MIIKIKHIFEVGKKGKSLKATNRGKDNVNQKAAHLSKEELIDIVKETLNNPDEMSKRVDGIIEISNYLLLC